MDSLVLQQNVRMVFIVTPELKNALVTEIDNAIAEATRQSEQFDFRARQALAEIQRTDLNRAMQARQQIETEKRRMDAIKSELTAQKTQIDALEMGAEYQRGMIHGQVEIKVGDKIFDKLSAIDLIIEDGVVKEIRENDLSAAGFILPQMASNEHGE
ncbi:MAG: YlqD family protein [bacterium]